MAGEVDHDLVGAGFAAAEGLEGELEPASSGAVSAAIGRNDSSASTEARGSTAVPPRPPPHVPPLTANALGSSDGGCGGGVAAAGTAAVRAPPSGDEFEQNHEGEGRRDSGSGVQDVTLVSRAAAGIAARADAQAGSGEDERMEEEGGDSESTVSTVEKKKKRRKKKKSKKSKSKKIKDPSSAGASEQPVLLTTKADPAVTAESISATVADCAESVAAVQEQRGPLSCLETGQALNTRACRQDGAPGKEMGANDNASGLNRRAYQLSKGVAGLAASVDGNTAGSAGEDIMLDRQAQGPDAEPFKAGVERRGFAGTEPSAGPTIVEVAASVDGEGIEGYGSAGLEAVRVGGSIGGARVPVTKRAVIAMDSSAALGAATELVLAEASGAPVGGGDVYTTDSIRAEEGGRRGAGERGEGEAPETASEAQAGLQSLGTVVTRRAVVTRPTFAPPSLSGEGAEGDQTRKAGRVAGDGPSEMGDEAWEPAVAPMQSFRVTETNTTTGWTLATSSVGRAATGGDQAGPGRAAKISSVVREMTSAAAAARVGTTGIRETRGTVRRPSLAAPSVGSETETTEGDQTEGEGSAERGSDGGGVTARELAVGAAVAEARSFALKHARGNVRWPSLGAPSTGSETTEGDQAEVKAAGEEEEGAGASGGLAFAPVTTGVGSLGMKEAFSSRRQEQRAAAAAALSTLDAPKTVPAREEEEEITSGKSRSGEVECPVIVAPDLTNEWGIIGIAEKLAGDECRGLMSDDMSVAVTTPPVKNPETHEIEDAVAGLVGDVAVVEPVRVVVATETAASAEKLNSAVDITKAVGIEGRGAKEASEDVEATTPVALTTENSVFDSGKVLVDVDGAAWDGVAGHVVGSTAAAVTSRSDASSTAVITSLQTDQGDGWQRDVAVAPPVAIPGVIGKLLRSPKKIGFAEGRNEPTADELTTNATGSAAAAAASAAAATKSTLAVVPEVVVTAGIVSAGAEVETTADLKAVVEPAAKSADPTLGRAERHGGVSVEASPALLGEANTGACEARAGADLTVADASVEPAAVELSAPTLGQEVGPKANPIAMRGCVVQAVVAATTESSAPSELSAGRPTASKPRAEADETGNAEDSVARTSSALAAAGLAAVPVDALPREYVKDLGQTATAVVTTTTDIHSFTAIDGGMEEAKVVDIFVSLGGGSSGGAWPGSSNADNSPGITVEEAAAFMGSALSRRFGSGSSWATTATSTIADVDRAGTSIPAGSPTPAGAIAAAPLMSPSLAAAAATMFSGTGDFMSPTNYRRSFGDGNRRHSSDASGSPLVVPASGEATPGPHDVFLSTTTASVCGADGGRNSSSRSTAAGMALAAGVVSTAFGGHIVSAAVDGGVVDDGEEGGGIEGGCESLAKVVRKSDALSGVDGGAAIASGSGRRSSLSGDYCAGSDEANSAHDAAAKAGEGVRGEKREEDGRLDDNANGSSVVSASAAAAPTEPITSAVSGVVVEEFAGDYCSQEGRGGGGGGGGDGDAASAAAAASTKSAAGSAATSIVGNRGGEVETGYFVGDDHGGRPVSGGRGASGGGGCCVVA